MMTSDTTLAAWQYWEMTKELVNQGKPTEALALLREAIALHPERAELYREMGILQEQLGDFDGEIVSYRKAIDLAEQPDWVYPTLADLFWRKGQLTQAIAVCEEGLAIRPQHELLAERLAVFQQEHQLKAVSTAPAQEGEEHTVSLNFYLLQVKQLTAQEAYQDAIDVYTTAIEQYPEQAELYRELGVVQEKIGDFAAEIASYRKAIELDENQPVWVYLVLGKLLREQESFTNAVTIYQAALQRYPENSELYRELGITQEKIGDKEEEIASYQKAIELEANQPDWLYLTLFELLTKENRTDEIPALCQIYLTLPGTRTEKDAVSTRLIEAWLSQGEYQQAIDFYEQATQHEASNPLYLTHLGKAYTEIQAWDKAIHCYQQAIDLNPQDGRYQAWLGRVFTRQQQWHEASILYRKAIALDPEQPDVLAEAADGFEQEGAWGEAIICCTKLLKLQPDRQEIHQKLKDIRLRRQVEPDAHTNPNGSDSELIARSGLFDEPYYLKQYPEVANSGLAPLAHYLQKGAQQNYHPNPFFQSAYYREQLLEQNPESDITTLNPLAHYLRFGTSGTLHPHPLFDTAFYLARNPDVAEAEINPLIHYCFYGLAEERRMLSVDRVRAVIQDSEPETSPIHRLDNLGSNSAGWVKQTAKVGVYASSGGNYFMTEIADLIASAFERIGVTAIRLCETDQRPADLDFDIVVAPHEFFYIGSGREQQDAFQLSKTIMVNVEQPHTPWFAKAFYFLRQARFVLDINLKSAALLEQLGVAAYFLPLGYLPDYEPFQSSASLAEQPAFRGLPRAAHQFVPHPDMPLKERPLDLLFVGTVNSRRKRFLAESASWLSQYQCFLHIPPIDKPLLKGEGQTLDTQAIAALSQRSKILLNVHREDLPYFEWHRLIFQGIWQNTLVLTEPCHRLPGLVAGEHFIECPLEEMKDTVHGLLRTPEGQTTAERIRQAGYRALRENMPLQETMNQVLRLLFNAVA